MLRVISLGFCFKEEVDLKNGNSARVASVNFCTSALHTPLTVDTFIMVLLKTLLFLGAVSSQVSPFAVLAKLLLFIFLWKEKERPPYVETKKT